MQIHQAFPTLILETQAEPHSVAKWAATARNTIPDDSVLRNWTIKRPWSTEDNLHTLYQWQTLASYILTTASTLLDTMHVIREGIGINSMWLNAQYQRTNHQAHIHSNSYLSGVIYLQVPENSQYIQFYDPRAAANVIRPLKHVDDETAQFTPSVGKMLLWPSWLLHSTNSRVIDELEEPRLCVSFNVMLKGRIDLHSARMDIR